MTLAGRQEYSSRGSEQAYAEKTKIERERTVSWR